MQTKVAIIGGGAAGFFLAINLKEMLLEDGQDIDTIDITIFERSANLLSKVIVSGGGRCNCTNTFDSVSDLRKVYPRGSMFMKKIFNTFSPKDAFDWFERHQVSLKVEDNGRVFPKSNDSHTIVNMFLYYAQKYHIHIKTNTPINSLSGLEKFDFVAITIGGSIANKKNNDSTENLFDDIAKISTLSSPIPSLFGFCIEDKDLRLLSGISIDEVTIMIPKTKFKVKDSILLTHKGLSGPCVLKLSSFAAQLLNDNNYKTELIINWINLQNEQAAERFSSMIHNNENKIITTLNPFSLPNRFWTYILTKTIPNRLNIRYKDLTKKEINLLINSLCSDKLFVSNRAMNKEEFVTCGGVDLTSINQNTMQSKTDNKVFFAGEILNADGITGGYNFQQAWSTAFLASKGIFEICKGEK